MCDAELCAAQDGAAECAGASAQGDGETLANGALWVYSIAFDEFRRALAIESKDRAELLAAMWDHCFALVQARAPPPYSDACAGCAGHVAHALHPVHLRRCCVLCAGPCVPLCIEECCEGAEPCLVPRVAQQVLVLSELLPAQHWLHAVS